jgi:4-cresol dehydrogenase (hydroxylating)
LDLALNELRAVLGSSNVIVDKDSLQRSAAALYELENRVVAIAKPRSREDVQGCVRIASRYGVPLYPISRGKNFGYGSSAPTKDLSIVVDLSLMSRIELHRENASVSVEPGVTTSGLAKYLARHAPEIFAGLPVNTSPHASALGNALDGGVGVGPYADRFAHVYGLDVVLGTGQIVHTGFDRLEGGDELSRTEARIGPSLREMFVQSNFGVVTRMTFGTAPMPRDVRTIDVRIGSLANLETFIERMRPLVLSDVLTGPFSMYNEYSNAQTWLGGRYPWAVCRGRAPLPLATLNELGDAGMPAWMANINLWCHNKELGDARERTIRRALPGFEVTSAYLSKIRHDFVLPDGNGIPLLYWRKRHRPSKTNLDPHKDRCGFMWCDFVVPADGQRLVKLLPKMNLLVRSYGFEPAVQIHTFWPRALFFMVNLIFDRDIPGEDERARSCDEALTQYLGEFGVLPTRRRVGSMHLIPAVTDDTAAVFDGIRQLFDPANIIAPGRYAMRSRAEVVSNEKKSSPPTAVSLAQAAHDSLLKTHRSKPGADFLSTARPARPYYMARADHQSAVQGASAFLRVLTVGAEAMVKSPHWRLVLGLDDRLAEVLGSQLSRRGIFGTLTGGFTAKGDCKLIGLETAISPPAAVNPPTPFPVPSRGWEVGARAAGVIAELCRRLRHASIVNTKAGRELAAMLSRGGSKVNVRSLSYLNKNEDTSFTFADGWRQILSSPKNEAIRDRLLSGLSTNAASDLLLSNAAVLAFVADRKRRAPFASDLESAIDQYVPWTRLLETRKTDYGEKTSDLHTIVLRNQDRFVIEPVFRDEGAIVFGEFTAPNAWRDAVRRAIRGKVRYVVQERVSMRQEVFPIAAKKAIDFEGFFLNIRVPVLDGEILPLVDVVLADRPMPLNSVARTYSIASYVES